jgi:hypothetical protein
LSAKNIFLSGKSRAAFVGFRGRQRSSMFFKRGHALEYIRRGSIFQRTHADTMVETARVIGVSSDSFGIPHVRYEVRFGKSKRPVTYFDGPRTLSLSTFTDTYRERGD